MVQRTRLWTIAIATAGLIGLPIVGTAQTYPPSSGQSGSGQTGSSSQWSSGSSQNTPQVHLDEAKKALDAISISSLSGDAKTEISNLKTQFNTLYGDWQKSSGGQASASGGTSSTSGQVGTAGTATTSSSSSAYGATDWRTDYTRISQALDRLNIPSTSSPGASSIFGSGTSGSSSGMSGTTGSSGMSGTSGSSGMSGTSGSSGTLAPMLGADVRAKLANFRMHLDQFYQMAGSGSPSASSTYGRPDQYGSWSSSGLTSSQSMAGTMGTTSSGTWSGSGVGTTGTTGSLPATSALPYLDNIDNIVDKG